MPLTPVIASLTSTCHLQGVTRHPGCWRRTGFMKASLWALTPVQVCSDRAWHWPTAPVPSARLAARDATAVFSGFSRASGLLTCSHQNTVTAFVLYTSPTCRHPLFVCSRTWTTPRRHRPAHSQTRPCPLRPTPSTHGSKPTHHIPHRFTMNVLKLRKRKAPDTPLEIDRKRRAPLEPISELQLATNFPATPNRHPFLRPP